MLTRLIFFARERTMTFILASVSTALVLPTSLLASLRSILAITRLMTWLPTEMEAALQSAAADFTTAGVLKPAGLILQMILPA